jgi:hypothetical protein
MNPHLLITDDKNQAILVQNRYIIIFVEHSLPPIVPYTYDTIRNVRQLFNYLKLICNLCKMRTSTWWAKGTCRSHSNVIKNSMRSRRERLQKDPPSVTYRWSCSCHLICLIFGTGEEILDYLPSILVCNSKRIIKLSNCKWAGNTNLCLEIYYMLILKSCIYFYCASSFRSRLH